MKPDELCQFCGRPLWMCPETRLGGRWVPMCELARPPIQKEQRRKEAR